jgi:hypothetical protein
MRSAYYNKSLGELPYTLVELDISRMHSFQQPLGKLPSTLEQLTVNAEYNVELQDVSADTVVKRSRFCSAPQYTSSLNNRTLGL